MAHSMSSIAQLAVVVAVTVILGGVDGKPPLGYVVRSGDGAIVELPYQVSVFVNGRHRCSGTIIGKRHILTAARCIYGTRSDPIRDVEILTGTSSNVIGTGKTYEVKNMKAHPDYAGTGDASRKNDIAVISVKKDIDFNKSTQSVRLPTKDAQSTLDCIASGWGDLNSYLQKAKLTTLDNASCRQRRSDVTVLGTQLCAAAYSGVGLCFGDLGSPLVHKGEIVGVACYVTPCAKGVPDIFTRVYSHLGFIKQAMAST